MSEQSERMEITSTDLLAFDPSCSDVWNACMSYRHDFGLLPDAEQKALEFEAREWLRAWGHTLPQFKANAQADRPAKAGERGGS